MTGPCTVTHPPFGGAPGRSGAEPVFAEPWQAQAFAMVLQLHQRGLFSWPEWAAALAAQISAAQPAGHTGHTGQTEGTEVTDDSDGGDDAHDSDDGRTYYRHWLAALEALVTSKGAASTAQLARCAQAWHTAAGRTPHGQPVVLQPADFGPA